MNFSWDDDRRIHPRWPAQTGEHPTLIIPSSQKNKKSQEIPMLPGLQKLLERVPKGERRGWIANPLPAEYAILSKAEWFRPSAADLGRLAGEYSNCAIARACGVTETTVRKWFAKTGLSRPPDSRRHGDMPAELIEQLRDRAQKLLNFPAQRSIGRLTKETVGRIISLIGQEATIVVQQANKEAGRRIKYASAHDLRRGCAQRLINAGVSAETLKLVLRHRDFKTTERFYGATRAAQSAAAEIVEKLVPHDKKVALVGGLVGGIESAPALSPQELAKLKALLNSL
jgi:hypothetical protein